MHYTFTTRQCMADLNHINTHILSFLTALKALIARKYLRLVNNFALRGIPVSGQYKQLLMEAAHLQPSVWPLWLRMILVLVSRIISLPPSLGLIFIFEFLTYLARKTPGLFSFSYFARLALDKIIKKTRT